MPKNTEAGAHNPGIMLTSNGHDYRNAEGSSGRRAVITGTFAAARESAQKAQLESAKTPILAHLDCICKSSSFESSRRCQQFLRYIVLETIEGRGGFIKERNIAHEVFGKGIDFEPGEDSLVRVKAREVRKRLSEYYELAPSSGLRIELPLGGYVPCIHSSWEPATVLSSPEVSANSVPRHFSRRRLAWMLGGTIGALGTASLWPVVNKLNGSLETLWQPVFATKAPLVIFIPILTDRSNGALSDRVGIGPAMALRRAADFLDKHRYPYHLRFGADLSFAELREQPSLLLGGFSSIWTQLMTRNLRFSLMWSKNSSDRAIVDTRSGQAWKPVNPTPEGYASQDYGLLCRLFDKESGQIAMIAGGLTTFGTEGAAAVFFNNAAFEDVVKQAPSDWKVRNFEAVICVSIIGTTASSPQLVASHFW